MSNPGIISAHIQVRQPVADLSAEQRLCQWLRLSSKDHTYRNDGEILATIKGLLDHGMQVPSTDEIEMLRLMHRACGVLAVQQMLMALVSQAYRFVGDTPEPAEVVTPP